MAPKLQASSGPHDYDEDEQHESSPLQLLSPSEHHQHHSSAQNFLPSAIDAFALHTSPSPPSSQSQHHYRSFSDCSVDSAALGSCGNVDFVALPLRDQIGSASVSMAQPTISRHTTSDAWAQRLEQRADHYTIAGHQGTPLTSPASHSRHSPVTTSTGGQSGSSFHSGSATSGSYGYHSGQHSSNGHVTPYHRSSQTPVTPSFSDFTMDSVITSPQVDRPPNWEENPASPFDYQYDPNSPPAQQHQPTLHSNDTSRVPSWWSPTTGGAAHQGQHGQRPYRQTSAPAPVMPPGQTQYGAYYPNQATSQQMSSSGLMINCQPGAHELGSIPSMPARNDIYGSSAPASHNSMGPYSRHPSMPDINQTRRINSHVNGQGHQSALGSSSSSRRSSKSQNHPHRRNKSSASPPRQGSKQANSQGSVGFVNFTPHDSKRILTGVAPSGSSKTKARREKEAAERRRQLNEAAQRAVIQAGGDPAALERSGLFAS